MKDLRATIGNFKEDLSAVELRVTKSSSDIPHLSLQEFLRWFKDIFEIREPESDLTPEVLIRHIRWAQGAKRHYLDFLKAAFSTQTEPLPRWVYIIFKLGRYGIASKAFVQLASEFPALFNPMVVEAVTASVKTPFAVPQDELPLTYVLRRVVGGHDKEYLSRLARVWNTADPEMHFRRACPVNLAVHAETQLVSFYDHNPQCKPSFCFIGVSKKSCYLCYMFLASHPGSFCVSSCHQKLYVSWILPPATNTSVYRQYKAITGELSKVMEAAAKQDLEDRLGSPRKRMPADSSAGVSISGLTESGLARAGCEAPVGLQTSLSVKQKATIGQDSVTEDAMAESKSSFHPIEAVNLTLSKEGFEPAINERMPAAIPSEQSFGNSDSTSISEMVFHFIRADNARQDIVSIADILDPSNQSPSWIKLVEILKTVGDFGLAFKEGHGFLMVNNRIRVSNERQFLACLQYLRNLKVLNSEVLVCDSGAMTN